MEVDIRRIENHCFIVLKIRVDWMTTRRMHCMGCVNYG